jgi:surfeit locus 1 family protein
MRRLLLPLAFGLIGTAILIGLGTWQVQRLAWKNGIIATIEARLAADPVAVPAAPDPEADRYRRVAVEGAFQPGELHVYTSAPPRGVGYRVIAPFETADGRRILVDRGFVPIGDKDAIRPSGPAIVEGALVWPDETDRWTSPPDRDKNIWFARDVALMSDALGTEPLMIAAATASGAGAPMPLPVTPNIVNNHLEYAVTWFGLATVWAVMTVFWLWRIKRRNA